MEVVTKWKITFSKVTSYFYISVLKQAPQEKLGDKRCPASVQLSHGATVHHHLLHVSRGGCFSTKT